MAQLSHSTQRNRSQRHPASTSVPQGRRPVRSAGSSRVSPSRRAPSRRRASPKGRKMGLFMKLYMVVVFLSAVIVATDLGLQFLIRPPSIPQTSPNHPVSNSIQGEKEEVPTPPKPVDPNALIRQEGVYTFLLLGKDVKGSNTDTIMVARYDTVQQKVGMISIPRDTAVLRTWSKYPKINGAFFGSGPDTLKQEIQSTFGIPIDYYLLVDLKGFVALVDALGGVDIYIPEDMNYDDPTPGEELHIHFKKGQHHLNGTDAMKVVRFRHNNDGTGYTDVGRAEMQRQVLMELGKKVLSWNSLTKVKDFIEIFQKYVKTDISAQDMLYFATQGMKLNPANVTQATLPGRGDGVIGSYKWCYVFEAQKILPILNEQVNPYTRPLTERDLHLPQADRYLQ